MWSLIRDGKGVSREVWTCDGCGWAFGKDRGRAHLRTCNGVKGEPDLADLLREELGRTLEYAADRRAGPAPHAGNRRASDR